MSAAPVVQAPPPYGPVTPTMNIVGWPVIRVAASAISTPPSMAAWSLPLAATACATVT
jgi:hypothetical protein